METEIWRDIEGYEGLYQVSNLGRVKSLNYNHTGKEKCLKPHVNGYGYIQVNLYKNGGREYPLVHRLVAVAFIPNPNNYPQVNHINENKEDNRVENLEWILPKDNIKYGTRTERMLKNMTGPRKPKSIICVETGKIYPSSQEASRQIGAHQSQGDIIKCCQGKQKTAKGYHWQYAD